MLSGGSWDRLLGPLSFTITFTIAIIIYNVIHDYINIQLIQLFGHSCQFQLEYAYLIYFDSYGRHFRGCAYR